MWSFPERLLALWILGSLPVAAGSIGFRTRELPLAAMVTSYRAVLDTFLDGRCLDGGASFALVDGSFPHGLELRGNTISGVAEEFGAFPVRIQVSNDCGVEERDFVVQVTGRPILRVAPARVELEFRAGGAAPAVQVLMVSATWPGYRYSLVRGSEPWLKVRQHTGMIPRPGSPFAGDLVEIQVVPESLAPGVYEAALVFCGSQGAVPVTVPVRLRVTAAAAPAATVGVEGK